MGFHLVFCRDGAFAENSPSGEPVFRRRSVSARTGREGRGEKDERDEEHEKGKENGPLDVSILLRKP